MNSTERTDRNNLLETQSGESAVTLLGLITNVSEHIKENLTSTSTYWVRVDSAKISEHHGNRYIDLSDSDNDGKQTVKAKAMIWKNETSILLPNIKNKVDKILSIGVPVLVRARISLTGLYSFQLFIVDLDSAYTIGSMVEQLAKIIHFDKAFPGIK